MTSKTKGVAECCSYCSALGFPESEVEPGIQFGIVGEMIDSWWDPVVDYAHDTGDGFYDAGGAKAMAGHRFGRTDIDGISAIAKNIHDGLYLGSIA